MVRSQAINQEPCSGIVSGGSGDIIGVLENGDLKMVIREVNSL
jgi:hypothetical protein